MTEQVGPSRSSPSDEEVLPSPIASRLARVLIVEESDSRRSAIALSLERAGCHPIEVACAEDGWIAAMSHAIDLVMVSHSLPDMSGAELVRLLRASQDKRLRQVPVIGLSHHELSEQSTVSEGVTCFIRGPHHEPDLIRAIRWVAEVYWSEAGRGADGAD